MMRLVGQRRIRWIYLTIGHPFFYSAALLKKKGAFEAHLYSYKREFWHCWRSGVCPNVAQVMGVCMSICFKLFRALIVFCSFWASFMVHITLLIHVSCVYNILLYTYIYTGVCLDVSVYIYIYICSCLQTDICLLWVFVETCWVSQNCPKGSIISTAF
jgi:hypothetical protein